MSDTYDDGEVGRIVTEIRQGGSLEELHCPRDGSRLRIFISQFRAHTQGSDVAGVVWEEWGDVWEISVECGTCSVRGPRISLLRSDERDSTTGAKRPPL